MAYPLFHRIYPELEEYNIEPAFYDTDGSPAYEDPYGGLLSHIVGQNDLVALRLYQDSPHTKVFWEEYEVPSWHPLFVAVRCGSLDAFRALLEIYIADPTYTEPLDKYLQRLRLSPIHVACDAAHRELTLWLLHHDPPLATLHDRDTRGETPLFSAARGLRLEGDDSSNRDGAIASRELRKHEDFICFLLDRGCSVCDSNIYVKASDEETSNSNYSPELEQTVLGAAIPYASYRMVSRLIIEGAKVHARQSWWDSHSWDHSTDRIRDGKGVTALHIASLFGNLEGIHALIDNRGDVSMAEMVSSADDQGRLPLHWALLGPRGDEPWHESIGNNYADEIPSRMMNTIRLLLEANPDSINVRDKQGATVFNYAVKSDAGIASILSVVKMLLDAKPLASILSVGDPVGATALQDAVGHHYRRRGKVRDGRFIELIETFLANGADSRFCLHRLCSGHWHESINPVMVDRLLESTDINDPDADGCTALHYLVRHLDQIDAARHLISRGADVNAINHKGDTPLHEVMKGALLRRLDENGMPDPAQSRDDPIRVRQEWIKVLVDAGGSMDQPNAAGQTPTQLLDERTKTLEQKWQAEAAQSGWRG